MKAVPRTIKKQVGGRIAGWSQYVKSVREKALFWHQLWVECGRPRSGAVADCMRRTRAAYHYTVRSSDDHNFWAEIKKIRGNRSGRSSVVDSMSNDSSIADVFVPVSYTHLTLPTIYSV